MKPGWEYIGGSQYYEEQARKLAATPEGLVYATLAQQQATLALVAAIREAAETGVRVVND